MGQRIVIMAGGTGGHVFPALAVALNLAAKDWKVSWIGTKQGMESRVVPAQGIEIDWVSVQGIRGKGLGSKLKSVKQLLKSFWQVLKIFRQRKPDVVLGMGGYVAGPGGMVASLLRIPLVIHEQNRVPGTTNRLLVNKADRVLEAFPESFSASANAIFTGNPLRQAFMDFPVKEYWTKASTRNFRILVIGGSQGAKILDDIIPDAVEKLKSVEIKHQTGNASFESVSKKYAELAIEANAVEFIEDIASAYKWADMVICRSGAMTVSEIAAAGLPAIFVPLPHAIDDHQTANAKYLVDAGAGILLMQNELNEKSLLIAIREIQASIDKMSMAARKQAKMDATRVVADICIKAAA